MHESQSETEIKFLNCVRESGVKGHEKLEKTMTSVMSRAADADLKALASATMPVIRTHLQVSRAIVDKMSGKKTALLPRTARNNAHSRQNSKKRLREIYAQSFFVRIYSFNAGTFSLSRRTKKADPKFRVGIQKRNRSGLIEHPSRALYLSLTTVPRRLSG